MRRSLGGLDSHLGAARSDTRREKSRGAPIGVRPIWTAARGEIGNVGLLASANQVTHPHM